MLSATIPVSGHALLASAEQVSSEPPLCQRHLGALKHGAHGHGELTLALVAIVQARAMRLLLALDFGNALTVSAANG